MSTSSILVAAVCAIGLSVAPMLAEGVTAIRFRVTNHLDNPGEELAVTFHKTSGKQTRSVRVKAGEQESEKFEINGDNKTRLVKVWNLKPDGSRNEVLWKGKWTVKWVGPTDNHYNVIWLWSNDSNSNDRYTFSTDLDTEKKRPTFKLTATDKD